MKLIATENTLVVVHQALRKYGLSEQEAIDCISEMQNRGIYFRENAKDLIDEFQKVDVVHTYSGKVINCGNHRGPQGPNEDVSVCSLCWSPSYVMRPEGETYGNHLPDCSLDVRHESYCEPGGEGHPASKVIRG